MLVIAALAAVFIVHAVRFSHTTNVTRIIDAASIRCDDGRLVRLIGLAALPNPEEAALAKRYLGRFILGKPVRIIEARSSRPEKAYVYYGDILVNGRMIKDGYGRIDSQDDCPEQELFRAYEQEAKTRGLGIWNDTSP